MVRKLSEPTRTAMLMPFPPRTHVGGVEVFSHQIREALGPTEEFSAPITFGPRSRVFARLGLLHPYRAFLASRAFLKAHLARPFDLVISHGLFGWPLCFQGPEIPMVQVYHLTFEGLARRALSLRGEQLTTAAVARWFDRASGIGKEVVSVSESVRREVSEFYGLPSRVIPNCVDVNLFHPMDRRDAREQLGLPMDRQIGLFVGRPEYAKGFDRLCAVAGSMKEALFLAVSRPAPAPANVRCLGGVPHERMPLLYSAADFFVSPSRYEGFNLSLLEALASGVPAVVSRAACAFGDDPSAFAVVADPPEPEAFLEGIHRAEKAGPLPGVRERIVRDYSSVAFEQNWRELASLVMKRAAA